MITFNGDCCYCSVAKLCPTVCGPLNCSMPGSSVFHLLQFAQIHVHSQWCYLLISSLPPSSPFAFSLAQHQGLFQWFCCSIRWPKYWSFSYSISASNEYSELISFIIDWFDLLSVEGIIKSLLQHHNSKA